MSWRTASVFVNRQITLISRWKKLRYTVCRSLQIGPAKRAAKLVQFSRNRVLLQPCKVQNEHILTPHRQSFIETAYPIVQFTSTSRLNDEIFHSWPLDLSEPNTTPILCFENTNTWSCKGAITADRWQLKWRWYLMALIKTDKKCSKKYTGPKYLLKSASHSTYLCCFSDMKSRTTDENIAGAVQICPDLFMVILCTCSIVETQGIAQFDFRRTAVCC